MVELQTGEKLFSDETLKVFQGGTYAYTDLVLVIKDGDSEPSRQYPAYFIKTGDSNLPEGLNIEYKSHVFKLTNSDENPYQLDYDIFGLHKNRIIEKGELILIEYYKNYDYNTKYYSDLYVSEFRNYTRDEMGLVVYRTQTSNWILDNDTTGLTISHIKYYTEEEAIQEGITRRENMMDAAKTTLLRELRAVFGFPLNQSYAFDLLLSVKPQMDFFTQGYTQPLRDAISGSTKTYMLPAIKQAIINQLEF